MSITNTYVLENSLRIFLFHNAGRINIEYNEPLSTYIDEGGYDILEVTLALIKWELHHCLKIDLVVAIELSIEQIVEKAV
jgi:hypothetical protein